MTLLVATSVAEEGLDIRQCNVVIRFDLAKTVLAYIQSRGRARKPGSDYILMVERYLCWIWSLSEILFQLVLDIKELKASILFPGEICLMLHSYGMLGIVRKP